MLHLSGKEDPLSPRFKAFAVTLPVFADGECLPLPRSKALRWRGFPLTAHPRWVPHRSQQFRSGTRGHPRTIYSKNDLSHFTTHK